MHCGLTITVMGLLALPVLSPAAPDDDFNWVKEQQFWSFRAPVAQIRPAVKNKRWPSQPLDYFVLARIEQRALSPTPAADKRTLIRRVSFDLTGLPPTPEETGAFLRDGRAEAYERLVDRLLASPRFGERMASIWLPVARYAEDQAHQVGDDTKFFYPNAHKYRDWVIHAFNRDLAYDQFIRLQLAADKMAESSGISSDAAGDLPALGFLGLGPKYYNRDRLDVMADEWEDRVDTVTRSFLGLTVACARCHDHKFDPISTGDYYALAGVFASTKMVNKSPGGDVEKDAGKAAKLNSGTVHMIEDGAVTNLNVFVRGKVDRPGPVAARRFLRILSDGDPALFHDGSGRRELAEAIASRRNPLTARVMVNRLWGTFFGQPLVATPSNFGHSGVLPTHPELLDDLAVRFMNGDGWSVKKFVREIVLSSTYRQGSRTDIAKSAADAPNDLLWHMNRRRLTVEQWRDAVLFASGRLAFDEARTLDLDSPTNRLRTVYGKVSRMKLNDLLMQFDYPDANVHAEKRSLTTTAPQKLFMLNSPFMVEQSRALAARLTVNARETNRSRVGKAYELLFAREPERAELAAALQFLGKSENPTLSRWEQYAQILLASNEMLYVD